MRKNKYALVCVDIQHEAVDRLFHYLAPEDVKEGMKVTVPFGRQNKPIDGYVISLSDKSEVEKPKAIISTQEIALSKEMLELALWMKEKYYTTLINCIKCILPAGKLSAAAIEEKEPGGPLSLSAKAELELTEEQAAAVNYIYNAESKQPILIHGVTGSGKTEIYMRAIAKVISEGKQAIMLVPEIALTPQTVAVFKKRFGDSAAVTHSRLTAKERLAQWNKARLGNVSVMIGPRSAIFTPFDRLGIIIIDEEHEHSYRSESSPKFDTREVAIKRGQLSDALVLMGSATPSLESYYKTVEEKEYALLTLSQRVNGMFPEVNIVDMRRELVAGNTSILGRAFQDAAAEEIEKGRQVILFLNRRGHSPFVSCRQCGHVMACENCRVNYTYHMSDNRLTCHYCGKNEKVPHLCPACLSQYISYFGVGTQKVEEEVARLFPNAKSIRMDMDTTRKKHGHAKILNSFRKGEAQILIGTQMIAKGLDFPNVTLVGVVAADLSLFAGDFRSAEHSFQLLTQVSGRAGRAQNSGRVYIQTYNPEHYSITLSQSADYTGFYAQEVAIRRTMEYPPFTQVFMILFSGPDERALIMALQKLAAIMRYCNKKGMFEMLGPAPAFVSKIKKKFRWKLLVKCKEEEILKQFVLYCIGKLKENDPLKGMQINLTLNPTAME